MGAQLRALVIDDSGVMRKMVMKSLKESGLAEFEFVEAEDGQIALDKLKAEGSGIDICFVDWNMPNMTGVDFVRLAREHERENEADPIPMIMVTSEKTLGKVQTALDEAGANAFISKPFTVDELKRKLESLIEKAQEVKAGKEEAGEEAPASGGWFNKVFG